MPTTLPDPARPTMPRAAARPPITPAAAAIACALVAGAAHAQGPATAAEATLPEVRVSTARDGTTTEGTGRYGSDVATVGGRTPVPLRELPQSATVITRQRIEDQNMVSLEDAVRRTPGALVLVNDPGRSSLFVRGFELDNVLVDGLPAPLSSINGTQPDLAIFDRVEILRGPSGLFAGTGEPGGTVNLARKRARAPFAGSVTGTLGSWNHRRLEADVTGALNAAGTVRGRAVVAATSRDSFTDVTDQDQRVAYGTIELDLGPRSTLSLAATRLERKTTPFNGLPTTAGGALPDVPRSTFVGANWNRFESESTELLAELEHRFADRGRARVSLRHADRDVDFKYAYSGTALGPAGTIGSLAVLGRELREKSTAFDAHAARPFEAWGRRHEWIAGLDWRRYEQTLFAGSGTIAGPFPLLGFDPAVAEPALALSQRTRTVPEQFGVYGQLRLRATERASAIVGGRLARYESQTTNLASGAVADRQEIGSKFTPYLAFLYDLSSSWSAYASVAEIFQPQTALGAGGQVVPPREGRQLEAGVKGELMDGRLNVSAALFRLLDRNRAVPVQGAGFSAPQGEVRVQGVELEAAGTLRPGWEIAAGYAYTHTEHLAGAAAQVGQVFSTWTPRHALTLWTRYDLGQAGLAGWHVGGGVRAVSSAFAQSGAVRIEQRGYAVTDLQVGYRINRAFDVALTLGNVFDRKYFARVGGTSVFNYYGEPRSAMLRATYRF